MSFCNSSVTWGSYEGVAHRWIDRWRLEIFPAREVACESWLVLVGRMGNEGRALNYYKRHIGDYARKTAHLDFLEDAAYMRLLDLYYSREAPIPDGDAERLCRARTAAEKKAVRRMLGEFFELKDGAWHHDRCEREIAVDRAFIDQQRQKAAKRWANQSNAETMPEHMPRHKPGIHLAIPPTPTPTPIIQEREPAVPADPHDLIFSLGVSLVGESHRSLLGRLIKDHGKELVAAKIGEMAAMTPKPVAPHTWLIACLKPRDEKPERFKSA